MRCLYPVVLLCVGAAVPAVPAFAQCPDGSPPPCRGSAAAATARRPNPPLDDKTWIVLPFENVARVQDIDWLREASVNLLYLDMSRWTDIKVVDDERVSDLMREVPASQATPLGLDAGIGVARRAGAAKLVMGDLLKVGNRTRVVAKIFDVRTRQRLRSVQQEASSPDSLMVIFGRLARAILAADPPGGASLGNVGTTSLEAYQAYVSGVSALNRVDLDSAEARFARAVGFDSSFALAHYKLSVVYGWINPNDRRRLAHAERANRLSASLPPRERQLIRGQYQTSQSRWGEACQTYGDLLRADSTDVEAWYNLGECNYHDQFVAGDSARPFFRGSWQTAMRAFRKALELDPTYHLAYSHIPDILLVEQRAGCRGQDVIGTTCLPANQFVGHILRDGDTLAATPVPATNPNQLAVQAADAVRRGTWATNLRENLASAQAWVNAGPDEPRAHLALARALLRSGQPAEASREFALGRQAVRSTLESGRWLTDMIELRFKLDDSVAALARIADSLAARTDQGPNSLPTFMAMLLGRWQHIQLLFGTSFQGPPAVKAILTAGFQAMQGAPPANLLELEGTIDSFLSSQPTATEAQKRAGRTQFLMVTAPWTLQLERPAVLGDLDTTTSDLRFKVIAMAVRRDTARLRSLLVQLDSQLAALPREHPSGIGFQLSAEAHLLLRDTALALARLRDWEGRFLFLNPQATHLLGFGNLTIAMQSWGRTWLRLADLAAAMGDPATARRNYRKVVALWQTADPAFQPQVTRAREALARLGV